MRLRSTTTAMSDNTSQQAVRDYYAQFGEREWDRLMSSGDGAIEFALTCRSLQRQLPESGRILDIGGGPGRYAIWLAEHGYRVVLADLSPNLLNIARERIEEAGIAANIESVSVADARNLAVWGDSSFDAVLALGPFYHLPNAADRKLAASELVRVLKARGIAFIALMPRYALLRRTMLIGDERQHLFQDDWLGSLMNDGIFENDNPGRFNAGFGARPEEVRPFFESFGLESLELLGTESLSVGIQSQIVELANTEPATFDKILSLLEKYADDPTIHGLCSHLLYVGRKLSR